MSAGRRLNILICLLLAGASLLPAHGADPPPTERAIRQAIVLEAARQDVVEYRLIELLARFDDLALDLQSNGKSGSVTEKAVARIVERLQALKEHDLADARRQLRQAVGDGDEPHKNLTSARRQVEKISRELGSLLLRAGISHATEVFATEIDDIIEQEDELRGRAVDWRTSLNGDEVGARVRGEILSTAQKQIGNRLDRLLIEVGSLSYVYYEDALTAVRLSRTRKLLQDGRTVQHLEDAAADIERGEPDDVAGKQIDALTKLWQAELKVRPDVELLVLEEAQSRIQEFRGKQQELRRELERTPADAPPGRPETLQQLYDESLRAFHRIAPLPGLNDMQNAAGVQMEAAGKALAGGRREQSLDALAGADATVEHAGGRVNERLAKLRESTVIQSQFQAALRDLRFLQETADSLEELRQQTQDSGGGDDALRHLAEAHEQLGLETERFLADLPPEDKRATVLRRPLRTVSQALGDAASELQQSRSSQAAAAQSRAADSLDKADAMAQKGVDNLDHALTIKQLAEDVRELVEHLKDCELEQRDVRLDTEALGAEGDADTPLRNQQEVLARAVTQMKEIVALIQEADAIDPHLTLAEQAMTEAMLRLEEAKPRPAVPLQIQAEEALRKAQEVAVRFADRLEYMAEWMAQLEQQRASTMDLLQRQTELREQTEQADENSFEELAQEQSVLETEAQAMADAFQNVEENYQQAANEMTEAGEQLRTPDRDKAVQAQREAEDALAAAARQLDEIMESMTEFSEVTSWGETTSELDLISRTIELAAAQRRLRAETRAKQEQDVPELSGRQRELKAEADSIAREARAGREHIQEASREMRQATTSLEEPAQDEAVLHQQRAEEALRRAIPEMMQEALEQDGSDQQTLQEVGLDTPLMESDQEILRVFQKMAVQGQAVARKRSEWDSLNARDRAALNENFARELPLEYREFLKDYYQALSEKKP